MCCLRDGYEKTLAIDLLWPQRAIIAARQNESYSGSHRKGKLSGLMLQQRAKLRMLPDILNRRSLLQASGIGALNLWSLMRAQVSAERLPAKQKIRSCVFVYYYGGQSHLDTYDMKPDAPATVRGEFNPIATSAPGVQICEHLPHMAKLMHKVAIVRSMHHNNRLHDSAGTEVFTGRQGPKGDREEFAPISQFFPCHGAVLNFLRKENSPDVAHALLPWLFHNVVDVPCQGGGFLGSSFDPFQIIGDPASVGYKVDILNRLEGLSQQRVSTRRDLLKQFDSAMAISEKPIQQLRSFYDKAFELLDSKTFRQAMQIDEEKLETRERYGLHKEHNQQLRGQNLLMARRLVEAGVPFINVQDFRQQGQNWDSHAKNFEKNKKTLLPPADQSLSALIEELDERGLLDSTLIVATGEFGRTPKINGNAGRDHWPDCYSLLLAGGGIQGGAVYGSSDRTGAYPADSPVTPADLAATIYSLFGIDPQTHIHDQTGRPWRISDGRVIDGVFG